MFSIKKLYRYIMEYWYLTFFVLLSLSSYASVLISPTFFWPAIFASYAIPGILGLNLILVVILLFVKKKLILFPLVGLTFGALFIQVTFSFTKTNFKQNEDLSILSFNTRFFKTSNDYLEFSHDLMNWVVSDPSDIKCIQEYCTNQDVDKLALATQLQDAGHHAFVFIADGKSTDNDQGLAILSKIPFLDTGYVWKSHGSVNAGMYVDIKVAEDTLRIYNVHLESMGIVLRDYKKSEEYFGKIKALIKKLKNGAEVRSKQIEMLIAHTDSCPYPFIICGDFNETPYSYNYFKLRSYFQNSFEYAGKGFGFSFNSILFFLRIDHHFFNGKIHILDYKVDRSMKISDHFPTRGYYQLEK